MENEGKIAKRKKLRDDAFDWVFEIVLALVVLLLVFTFSVRTVDVFGKSMNPTLYQGEKLLINRLFYQPKRGDIVVVTKPCGDEPLIKRVIATEGQEINIDFNLGEVYVDGVKLDEPYIMEPTRRQADMTFPQTVPEGCVFVMGDNRMNSKDSRWEVIGMVDERYIMGKVILRLTPFTKFGKVE